MKSLSVRNAPPAFAAALFSAASAEAAYVSPVDEGVKETCWAHTVEYYSVQTETVLPFATSWLDLEGILLSEISRRKEERHVFSLTGKLNNLNSWEQSRSMLAGGRE